ncbi:hypothetical protein GY45DRAFT_1327315 [Cubamyces sp. BRFM 1775]|nr:hypothetical protein GY45DRAFT_1327315 [Cubamyces sp. BRFM 1775]
MKAFAAFLALSALSATVAAGAAESAGTEAGLDADPCFWSGTAPFCAGSCPVGYTECGRDSCGDGACCWTGYKVYCCREGSDQC